MNDISVPVGDNSSLNGNTSSPFPIVGIGASAGGLEAFKKFFDVMPSEAGVGFVLVQHLDPTHESMMVDLLATHTKMPVVQADEGMQVAPNCVYMIPPNRYLILRDGLLHLIEPTERRGMRMAIDTFFRSLADDQHEHAIGIILTGTASDGTEGLKAIKANGGMTLVQDPDTSAHDGMPRSAIATGMVDFVLPIEKMPDTLIRYAKHPYVNGNSRNLPQIAETQDDLDIILALLLAHRNIDFRHYKRNTLMRRIERRMGLRQFNELTDYTHFLRENPQEVEQLGKDLLIGVTRFFRDREAFDELQEKVIAPLIDQASTSDTLRIWVPGCATGEEAYTIAMLLAEQMTRQDKKVGVQIFASDIDDETLEIARTGVFPASIAADLGADQLREFFYKCDNDHFAIVKDLREMIVFARHNVISDPPFSKLDLISCRNLLIYLHAAVQDKLISLFHFALKPGGYLLLGNSENIGLQTNLFGTLSKKWRLYRRIGSFAGSGHLELALKSDDPQPSTGPYTPRGRTPRERLSDLAQRWILEEFAPPTVIVNRNGGVVFVSGNVDRYLALPYGEPNLNVLDMLRDGLRTRVRGALHRAVRDGGMMEIKRARMLRDGKHVGVKVQIKPLKHSQGGEGLLMLSFMDEPLPSVDREEHEAPLESSEELVRQLEDELKSTREDLQNTVEEMETSNEELKASNEEVMSINEELQSTNEELETSKEELQSLNEELSTVNSQLQDKIAKLEDTNNDIINLLNSTDVATLFLDTQFRIKRFTPVTTQLFSLISSDIGRPLSDLVQKFTDPRLLNDVQLVMELLQPIEVQVNDEKGRWFTRRVLPYRTQENRIDGVVVTFTDITPLHESERLANERFAQIEALYRHAPVGLAFVDKELRFRNINDRLAEIDGLPRAKHFGRTVKEVLSRPLAETVDGDLRRVLATGDAITDIELACEPATNPGQKRHWLVNYYPVRDGNDLLTGISLMVLDITKRKRDEEVLYNEKELLRVTLHSIGDAVITTDATGRVTFINPIAEELSGWTQEEARGQPIEKIFHLVHEATRKPIPNPVTTCLKEQRIETVPEYSLLVGHDGIHFAVQDSAAPIYGVDGQVQGAVLVFQDVTRARAMAQQVVHQATHDALTGLANRREFENRLQRALTRAKSDHETHVLCYMDLDQFKVVNDTCGHAAGDELLRQVATLFSTQMRGRDTLARLGGDEFGILIEHCTLEQATRVTEALLKIVQDFRFVWEKQSFQLSASIGMVAINHDSDSAQTIMRLADSACFAAKDAGRNRIHIYREGDETLAKRQGELQWVNGLQQALESDRLLLFAQPIRPLEPGPESQCFELLLRLVDQDQQLVLPGAFLPAAERYHLAVRIDRWVVAAVLRMLRAHPNLLKNTGFCTINLSGQSVNDEDFQRFVFDELSNNGIVSSALCFEITETAAIANLSMAKRFMETIKTRGCRFALDDFGSGLSSFSYLKNLPVDFVKIDGVFVKDIADDPIDLAMVSSINEIGHLLGKKTIAEFVETEQTLDMLRSMGVNYAQGNVISKPLPLHSLLGGYIDW